MRRARRPREAARRALQSGREGRGDRARDRRRRPALRETWGHGGAGAVGGGRYEEDGRLRAGKIRDALLDAPEKAAEQAVRIVEGQGVLTREGTVVPVEAQTICIHGDTPGAERIGETVRKRLEDSGVKVLGLSRHVEAGN